MPLPIQSFPGPDRSIRMDELRAGRPVARRYRNRRIGEFLKELELSEGRNTGIPTILRAMRENGSLPPVFETDDDRTYLLVRLPLRAPPPAETAQVGAQVAAQVEAGTKALGGSVLSDLAMALGIETAQVAAQVIRLLHATSPEPRASGALQAATGIAPREHFRKAYVAPLVAAGLIALTIPSKPNSRLQKYRLADAGRAWLAAVDAPTT